MQKCPQFVVSAAYAAIHMLANKRRAKCESSFADFSRVSQCNRKTTVKMLTDVLRVDKT